MKSKPNKRPDFQGWVTRSNVRCVDGTTILDDAFAEQDGTRVPLVYAHDHKNIDNVLGQVWLSNRQGGVWGEGYFNDTPNAELAKKQVAHGDLDSMSIFANSLTRNGGMISHGVIREVSLVLSGANPMATIETVIKHDGLEDDSMAEIYFNELLDNSDEYVEHSDNLNGDDQMDEEEKTSEQTGKTVKEVLESMTDDQRALCEFLVGKAVEDERLKNSVSHGGVDDDDQNDDEYNENDEDEETEETEESEESEESSTNTVDSDDNSIDTDNNKNENNNINENEGVNTMKHNVFDKENGQENETTVIQHDALEAAFKGFGNQYGSLKAAFSANGITDDQITSYLEHTGIQGGATHMGKYGITNMEYMFPDARPINGQYPVIVKQNDTWITKFMSKVSHTPFSRVKMLFADISNEEARALGYKKGGLKKEQVIKLMKRTTAPGTVYVKQKFDRDDLVDITDIDTVAWIKKIMMYKLKEEVARAALISDGRDSLDENKIKEEYITPIWSDDDFFTVKVQLGVKAATTGADKAKMFIDNVIRARKHYLGSGKPDLYTTDEMVTECLLLEDKIGRKLYKDEHELAVTLRVNEIITVPCFEGRTREGKIGTPEKTETVSLSILGLIVNPADYMFGNDKGGQTSLFDQFDIDYNQMKYLAETRTAAALTMPSSCLAIESFDADKTTNYKTATVLIRG